MEFEIKFVEDYDYTLRVRVFESEKELIASKSKDAIDWRFGQSGQDETWGFCEYNMDSKTNELCSISFNRQKLSRSLVVHECVHAAFDFVNQKIMSSEEVAEMSEEASYEYCHEALARVTEKLFEQIDEKLFA